MANDKGFPIKISPEDLKDPTLGRLARAFEYLWTFVQRFVGDRVPFHFLDGTGAYTPPVSASFPEHFDSAGEPGQIAHNDVGDIFVCYAANLWVRVGASGTSTSF